MGGRRWLLSLHIPQLLLKPAAMPPTCPLPRKEAMFLQLPRACGGTEKWGQGGARVLRYSKALGMSPVGHLPALSQGPVVSGLGRNQFGYQQKTFLA